MKIVGLIVRLLLGLMFLVFSGVFTAKASSAS
jgi:hypothetical protein